ncbi:flagellar protein FlaG [Steroidobacter sp. S1-65]|uniref:Flagellar protein FlaG n=1 Tax=Steroidobacter gossypii TaxID=2805490 RepID=A0ABS1X533_9GAMM|nr:flagellar protein FlaG [Steroidobacter gossypii]MBM0108313.1 flagellar protein FlaG [Steroidobacter gossypii]
MSRLDASQVEAGGEVARPLRSPSFPQPTAAAEATRPAPKDVTNSAPVEPSHDEVKRAAEQLETFMQSMNRYLEFRVDQGSGRTVVTVKDKTTGDTIRQIPSEEVLRLAQNLGGKAPTGLIDQTV